MASKLRAEAHLTRFAPLARFWIYRTEHTAPGLIHYSDRDGKAWSLMEDDEDLLDYCIALLGSRGCPRLQRHRIDGCLRRSARSLLTKPSRE